MGWVAVLRGEILRGWSRGLLNQGFHCSSISKVLLQKKIRNEEECLHRLLPRFIGAPRVGRVEDDNWIYSRTHRATFSRHGWKGSTFELGPLRLGFFSTHLLPSFKGGLSVLTPNLTAFSLSITHCIHTPFSDISFCFSLCPFIYRRWPWV